MKKINLLLLLIITTVSLTFNSCKKAEDEKSCYALGYVRTYSPPQLGIPASETTWVDRMCDITEDGAKFLAAEFDKTYQSSNYDDTEPYTVTRRGIYKKL